MFNIYVSDIDYCDSNPCQHGGSCNSGTDGYVCSCPGDYNSTNCETSEY